MTLRDRLTELLRQRAATVLTIGPLARRAFPDGASVTVRHGGQMVEGHVLSCDRYGESVTVRLPRGSTWSYPVARMLEWNPAAGSELTEAA